MARSTRETILTAAAELMRHKGFGAVAMKDVAAASGAPIGSLYHHFPGGKNQIAREALTAAGRVPRLPMPLKTSPEGISVPNATEAVLLVAALRAVARLSPTQQEVVSTVVAGDAQMEVRVRAPAPRVRH